MPKEKLNNEEKLKELIKYRDLVLATLDYYLDSEAMKIKTADFNSDEHYSSLKVETEEQFKKGNLSKLKQWFRDFTEMQVESKNFKFNEYLKDKTHFEINIFTKYFERVDRIIEKKKITTDNQFYDINMMVDQLCQSKSPDSKKIGLLNGLLADYEKRKAKKNK